MKDELKWGGGTFRKLDNLIQPLFLLHTYRYIKYVKN